MMRNIKIERDENGKVEKGIVTKAFLKKADIFGTEEYNAVQYFYEKHPGATITTKTITKNPDKKTYKNLTYSNIEKFLLRQVESEKLIEEYNKVKSGTGFEGSTYQLVRSWFINKFPNHNELSFEETAA